MHANGLRCPQCSTFDFRLSTFCFRPCFPPSVFGCSLPASPPDRWRDRSSPLVLSTRYSLAPPPPARYLTGRTTELVAI